MQCQWARTQILSHHGLSLRDFDTREEAYAQADKFVRTNSEMHGHEVNELPHEDPLQARFWFVKTSGKATSWTHDETKTLTSQNDKVTLKALQTSGLFSEALGDVQAVKQENGAHHKLQQSLEGFRPRA